MALNRGMRQIAMAVSLVALVAVTVWLVPDQRGPRFTPVRPIPVDVYNPVTAGEELPDGFRQLLPRDAIFPIYEPTFTAAADARWDDEIEVIGVSSDGESKAYPVSILNRREMVIDFIAGDPILVTW